jgi:hypothetical protein
MTHVNVLVLVLAVCGCAFTAVTAGAVLFLHVKALRIPKPDETSALMVSAVPIVEHSAPQMAGPLVVTGCPVQQFNWQHVTKSEQHPPQLIFYPSRLGEFAPRDNRSPRSRA